MTTFWADFHREWGKAKDGADYDKAAWIAMQLAVEQLEAAEERLRALNEGLAERVAAQSELLSRRATRAS